MRDQNVDLNTVNVLRNGDRYKLFKFILKVDFRNTDELDVIYNMLDQMPELEI